MAPAMPEDPIGEETYVVIERAGSPQPLSRPGPRAAAPKWSALVDAWLTSEFVNGNDYVRFAPGVPLYEGANWPLGLTFQARTDAEHSLIHMVDPYFDQHAKSAVHLPWRYSGLSFQLHPRREDATLTVRNIGHWDGEPRRYDEIVSTLARLRREQHPEFNVHASYAITPFCVIGQTWTEEYGPFMAQPVHTSIAFFYTFETFIQECLAIDARRAGASAAEIIAAYEHRYANVTWYPNLLLRDPTLMRLARYANPAIDWNLIGATPRSVGGGDSGHGRQGRSWREALFFCRLQTHLMVAIAVAFHGVATFANGHARSALVQTATAPPDLDTLAPHWLGHLLSDYDHAAECANLLESLALHYNQDLSRVHLRGMPLPPFRSWRDDTERSIITARPPLSNKYLDDPVDTFRWNLFEATLDDAAVTLWGEDTYRWLHAWQGLRA
jgi:hypothetical protein